MRKIFEILRLSVADGRSHREIARAIDSSPTTVSEILRRAKLAGLTYPPPAELSEAGVEALLYPPSVPSATRRPEPDWAGVQRELRRKGFTLLPLDKIESRRHFKTVYKPLSYFVDC